MPFNAVEGWMARLLALILFLFLQGCASQKAILAEPYAPTCTPLSEEIARNGHIVEAGYKCNVSVGDRAYIDNACLPISGFYNKAGTYVPSHTRCKSNHALIKSQTPAGIYSGGSSSSEAPCITGYCGPVNVRGYYRKDGTYVRPHTRSRGRK